jgi:hypothetical protein
VILALGASAALADGPDDGSSPNDVDPSGTTTGTAEDLAGIGIGGGQGFAVVGADGAVGGPAKIIHRREGEKPFAYNLAAI